MKLNAMNNSRRIAALVGFTLAVIPIVFASVLGGDATPRTPKAVEISVGKFVSDARAHDSIGDGCPGSGDARANPARVGC